MKLSIPNCPECGEQAKGTLEQMTGIALLNYFDDGTVEYDGSTDVHWDGQESVIDDETGDPILICHNGHQWTSKIYSNVVEEYREEQGVWSEYPGSLRVDWKIEVANGDTNLGYWEWAKHREEANG